MVLNTNETYGDCFARYTNIKSCCIPETTTILYMYVIIHQNVIIEIQCTINVMFLNHPETILLSPWSIENLSSTKLVPGAKNVGDHYFRTICDELNKSLN